MTSRNGSSEIRPYFEASNARSSVVDAGRDHDPPGRRSSSPSVAANAGHAGQHQVHLRHDARRADVAGPPDHGRARASTGSTRPQQRPLGIGARDDDPAPRSPRRRPARRRWTRPSPPVTAATSASVRTSPPEARTADSPARRPGRPGRPGRTIVWPAAPPSLPAESNRSTAAVPADHGPMRRVPDAAGGEHAARARRSRTPRRPGRPPPSAARGWSRGASSGPRPRSARPSFRPITASAERRRLEVRRRADVRGRRGSWRASAPAGRTPGTPSASLRRTGRAGPRRCARGPPTASPAPPSGCGANARTAGRIEVQAVAVQLRGRGPPSGRSRPTVWASGRHRGRRAPARWSSAAAAGALAPLEHQRRAGRPAPGTRRSPARCGRRRPRPRRTVAPALTPPAAPAARPLRSFSDLERGDPAGRAHDAAARMRRRAAHATGPGAASGTAPSRAPAG